ncbi:hypothetical protein RclHR1_19130002 [Rhizophagus clarus]|uniref:Mid2 domain-containing protein n=1 Tax=Rhizophagus clarus TaxID=94130 RepID=A0A2Z6R2D3_9GLOM|nr:hypothetical protein RclHR1_19130002 [Rhizophagus clarus]GES89896.1 hypothetical protein GLOIN_2v1587531 [Rhizophagus clarus]
MAQTNNNICHSSANPCIKVNDLLKPCDETLPMPPKLNDTDVIQNVNYFVGNSDEAKCWCSKEFYDLLINCTICLSGPSVNVTVNSLDEYKNDCKKYGTDFKEAKESSSLSINPPLEKKGPNKLLIALGVSTLVTLLVSLAFCIYVIRRRKKKSRVYEQLKTDYYSKGRGIDIGGRTTINENDEKELYSPSVPMPPPLAHQPQQTEQQQQQQQQQHSTDQNQPNPYNFNTAIYGEQQYYVEASQSQMPRSSYECSDDVNNSQHVYQDDLK